MHERFKALVLRWLKVPAEPQAPAGSPGSVKVFRAAPNFYKLKLLVWGLRQMAGAIGIVVFLVSWHNTVGRKASDDVNLAVNIWELAGIAAFLVQIPFTCMLVRLDYEMRWYIVTDRSLRIRTGIWNVREATLTFANIQQITVGQGPLQRMLGLYDLEVTTAGGGSGGAHHAHLGAQSESMHRGFFHGIDNAPEVRALILERQRHLRDTGLGDPDEVHHEEEEGEAGTNELLIAAKSLLAEVRRLREAAAGR